MQFGFSLLKTSPNKTESEQQKSKQSSIESEEIAQKGKGAIHTELSEEQLVQLCLLGEPEIEDDVGGGGLVRVLDKDDRRAFVAAHDDKKQPGLDLGEVGRLIDDQRVEVLLNLGELHRDVGRRHRDDLRDV